MKEQWIVGDSLSDSKDGFPDSKEETYQAAGDDKRQAHARVVACDQEMTRNYADNHVAIGNNIYPFLFSEFTSDGGRYTLLKNDSDRVSAKPGPRIYEQAKSIAHIPLGVWSIIARYAASPQEGDWIEPLSRFGVTVAKAIDSVPKIELSDEALDDANSIMGVMKSFVETAVQTRNFSIEHFTEVVYGINPELVTLQNLAARTQVEAFTSLLAKWQGDVGRYEWEKLYVVISAQWTLSTENVHQLIIANAMSTPELAATNIFVTSRPLSGLDEARALCGRIVGDRVMARQLLSTGTERGKENIYSLSSSRDLISKAAEDVLANITSGCPVGKV